MEWEHVIFKRGESTEVCRFERKSSIKVAYSLLELVISAMFRRLWFHDSQPSLGNGQSIYSNCMLNRTVPGEFLERIQCFLNIHIPRLQHICFHIHLELVLGSHEFSCVFLSSQNAQSSHQPSISSLLGGRQSDLLSVQDPPRDLTVIP